MTFTITASDKMSLDCILAKLAKKASDLNKSLSWNFGESYSKSITIRPENSVEYKAMVEVVDITIVSDILKIDGYTLLAYITVVADEENVVVPFNGAEVNPAWYSKSITCDHCGTNRARKYGYILKDSDGKEVMVGKGCLQQFTGIDPAQVALSFEINKALDVASFRGSLTEKQFAGNGSFPIREGLAFAVAIAKNGYRKADESNSNKAQVIEMFEYSKTPSAEALAKADSIIEWCIANDLTDNFISNLAIMARKGMFEKKMAGMIAYAPILFDRCKQREEEAKTVCNSQYIGSVGEKIAIDVTAKLLSVFDNVYGGNTFLYNFLDDAGNVFVWFGSKNLEQEKGTIKATIKAHQDYKGVKQTVVTRAKFAT